MTTSSPVASWDDAPVGLLELDLDGTVRAANRTLLAWCGQDQEQLIGRTRLAELLSVGGRIFWETHLGPLLLVEGRVDEVALELRTATGRMPVLLTAVRQERGIRVAVSSARDRSSYEKELLGARRAAESAQHRLQALQSTTAALSGAIGVGAVAEAVLDAAVGPLGAASAALWLAPSGDLRLHGVRGQDGGPAPAVPASAGPVEADGQVLVPLQGPADVHGVLVLRARDDPGADPLDLEVLRAVGQQAGLALDRAQRYEQSAGVAHELQQSLLSVAPPTDDRYGVATVYRPGEKGLEVGGDWHDVFRGSGGQLSIVVGDVVGHGLIAASAMGQLRSAVRAVALADLGPGGLLTRLDAFVEQVPAASMATLAYAELDLDTGLLHYACAGHPPPLLLRADGDVRLLWGGRSTPLGGFVRPLERLEARVQLRPGDRVLLYTDGLFERRGRALDDGLDLLCATATTWRDSPLEEAVQAVTGALLADEQGRDDVCVLLLGWTGRDFDRALPADLSTLSRTRKELRTWLCARGARTGEADDVVLAASEAVANAAEHGSGGRREGEVRLHARVEQLTDGPHLVVRVVDDGAWQPPVADVERGRGMLIISQLVDDLQVSTGSAGAPGTTVVLRRRMGRAGA